MQTCISFSKSSIDLLVPPSFTREYNAKVPQFLQPLECIAAFMPPNWFGFLKSRNILIFPVFIPDWSHAGENWLSACWSLYDSWYLQHLCRLHCTKISQQLWKMMIWPGASTGIFPGRDNVDIPLILFQIANDAHWGSQNALPFLHQKENSPWKQALRSYYFEIVFRWSWSCIRVCEMVVLFVILYNFCRTGVSSNIINIVNCRKLSLNWTWTIHNYVCGAHIILCRLNLTSENLFWNFFYTLAIRNAFSFQKLVISLLPAPSTNK